MGIISNANDNASHERRRSLFARLAGMLRAGRAGAAAVGRAGLAAGRELVRAAKAGLAALSDWLVRNAARGLLAVWLHWPPALDPVQWRLWAVVALALAWFWRARRRKRGDNPPGQDPTRR